MFRWIVGRSLKFRYLVLACAGGLMYFGIGQLRTMPVDVFPEFAPPMVEIQTISLGLSAEEVESLVTVPLEQVLAGVPRMSPSRFPICRPSKCISSRAPICCWRGRWSMSVS
jgi:Cu/Ag efflux pump CusA